MKKKKVFSALIATLLFLSMFGGIYAPKPISAIDNLLNEGDDIRNSESSLLKRVTGPAAGQGKTKEDYSDALMTPNNAVDLAYLNQSSNFAYVDGNKTRLVVGIDSKNPAKISELENIADRYQARIVNEILMQGKVKALVFELLLVSVAGFSQEVHASKLATYIEPNMKVQVQFVPDDPYWSMQWGPQKIEADWAWNTTIGDPSILVAVVDTGIFYSHPDLNASYVALGRDWANNDTDPIDDHGHGTHCAGIIAAILNNSEGIAGLAQARVMAEKVLDSSGWGYADWVANGIIHATDCGAKIISMSIGGWGDSELIHEAVKYAYDAGVLLVAAAGNEDTNMKPYPAGYDEVISVAATDEYDDKAYFSNWGDWIELAAPGVNVYSTVPGGYTSMSGTSMACPHVAGVAALAWSQYPNSTRDWVRMWLRYCADDLGAEGFDVLYGYGRVNARKAVQLSPPTHELIACSWTTPPYVKPGTSAIVNVTLLNFGNDETGVSLQLLANDTVVDSAMIGFLPGGNSVEVTLTWIPVLEGLYNLTFYVVPMPGEVNLENNVLSRSLFVGFAVKAVVLHSAGNVYSDIITSWQTLSGEWYLFGDSMVSIDYTTLNKEEITYADIAATGADVLIISCAFDPYAGWQFSDSEIEAIERYVYEGHGLIATAGTFYEEVPNNNKLASLFGMHETIRWDSTGTNLLHLLNTTHPLFARVPNPLVFPQVGTALPNDGRWDSTELVSGEYLGLGHYQESAIVTFRGLVYISPWLEAIPPYYQHHLQLLYDAIMWSRYQKPQHELVVSLNVPASLNPGESTLLNATVSNVGLNNETDVELRLFINGALVDDVTMPQLLVDSSYSLSYPWTPTVQGVHNITAYAPPIAGEEFTENNIVRKTVLVLLIAVRKVLVYSDDYFVAPSSRYVITALNELGINFTYYSDDPLGFGSALVSQSWDMVIVDHCNYYAIGNYWTELDDYVREGGLLVLGTFDIDGSNSEPTNLWDTLGVSWVSDMSYLEPVYRWVTSHDIFTFPNSVNDLTLYSNLGYNDRGDHVAATTGTAIAGFTSSPAADSASIVVGNVYQTVLFSFRVDEFRYDQDGDGKLDAIELWQNAIVYVARGFEHDLAVSLYAPTFLEPYDSVVLNATVRNRGLNNETDVQLFLLVNSTQVSSVVIPQLPVGAIYTLNYNFSSSGRNEKYNVTAYAPPMPDENATSNNFVTRILTVTYYARTYVSPQWVGGGVPMEWHADDGAWEYDLAVSFRFYDVYYDRIYISSNGLITFNWSDSSYGNSVSSLASKLAIAPAWDDWKTNYPYDIYIWQNQTHVGIRWNVEHYGSGVVADFEVILGADGVIQFNYGYNNGLVSATIGISNGINEVLAEDVTDINYASTIVFTPPPLACDLAVSLEAPAFLDPGESVLLSATIRNCGLNNETDVELQLLVNGTVVRVTIVPQLVTGTSFASAYLWTPTIEGTYNITSYSPPRYNETITENNVVSKMVLVGRPSGTHVYVSPLFVNTTVGTVFTVDVKIAYIEDLYGYEFVLYYNRTVLECRNITLPPDHFLKPQNPTLLLIVKLEFDNQYNATHGRIWVAIALLNPEMPKSGSGILVTLNFKGISLGESSLDLARTLFANSNAQPITHIALDGYVEVATPAISRDVALTNVIPYSEEAYEGWTVSISVVAANLGIVSETFNVTLYYDNQPIGTQMVTNLNVGEEITLVFNWNTSGVELYVNHTIWAQASTVPTETNTSNNTMTDGSIKVKLLGDVNGDKLVDIFDIVRVAVAFGAQPLDPRWDLQADVNPDSIIDIYDIVTVALHLNESSP